MVAAARVGLEHGLTQLAVFGGGHRGGVFAHADAKLLLECVGLCEDVVAYLLGLDGKFAFDSLEALLKIGGKSDTFALEALEVFLEHHLLLPRQTALVGVIDCGDPLIEALVEGDGSFVVAHQRDHLFEYGVEFGGLIGLGHVVEHACDLGEDAAAELQRGYSVLEGGLVGTGYDSLNLGCLLLDAGLDGGHIIGGFDGFERGNAERGFPLLEEGVLMTSGKRCCHYDEC